jgi:hypothetical protein
MESIVYVQVDKSRRQFRMALLAGASAIPLAVVGAFLPMSKAQAQTRTSTTTQTTTAGHR